MRKQHFTTEVAWAVNPPLLSTFQQVIKDSLENVYASRNFPLGRTKGPNISKKTQKETFGLVTKHGDTASDCLHPTNVRDFYSMYRYNYQFPDRSYVAEIVPAGLPAEKSENGKDELSNKESSDFPPTHGYSDEETFGRREKPLVDYDPTKRARILEEDSNLNSSDDKRNLLNALQDFVKTPETIGTSKMSSLLKSSLEKLPNTSRPSDLQKLFQNFGVPISLNSLEKVLSEYDVLDQSGNVNRDRFLNALNTNSKTSKDRKWILTYYSDVPLDRFKTSASHIGDHNYTNKYKAAGIPSFRHDIARPKLKKVSDFTEYGDSKSGSRLLQSSLFELRGIYDEDLGLPRPKQEIKSILHRSGVPFTDESFNMVWENTSKGDHASIGNIWKGLKHLIFEID